MQLERHRGTERNHALVPRPCRYRRFSSAPKTPRATGWTEIETIPRPPGPLGPPLTYTDQTAGIGSAYEYEIALANPSRLLRSTFSTMATPMQGDRLLWSKIGDACFSS